MKLALALWLVLLSGASFAGYEFALNDITLHENIDANDGVCSTKKNVEIYFNIYSRDRNNHLPLDARVYGTANIKQTGKSLRPGKDIQDWYLQQSAKLHVNRQGDFKLDVEINDSDYCGIGLSWLGGVTVNNDKKLLHTNILGNVNDLYFKQSKQGECIAVIPLFPAGMNTPLSANIRIIKQCQ